MPARQHRRPDTTPLAAAAGALTVPALAAVVDLVVWPDPDAGREADGTPRAVLVANSTGRLRLSPQHPDGRLVAGAVPWGGTDPLAFATDEREAADPSPPAERNHYPLPWPRLSSFFADPRSPDLAIVHTGRHYFPERGGHLGEHGSLSVVQSRAPLLLSGAGVRHRGVVPGHARLVDVMPTLAWVLGAAREELADLDGVVRDDLVTPGAAHVVGLLWDGAHAGSLLRMAEEGLLPNVSRLLSTGCRLAGGAVAEFPSLTLVNHTSVLTGVGPGRHGVVGNVYFDRSTGGPVRPNDPATWHRASELYRPGVRTLFEVVGAANPGSLTASVNEMTERGAQASTFALVRAALASGEAADPGEAGSDSSRDFLSALRARLPDPLQTPYVTASRCAQDDGYAFYSAVDLFGLQTVLGLWSTAQAAPLLTWWSSYTSDAAHHVGGPRSPIAQDAMIDHDRRLGALLDHLESLGVIDDTLVLLTADHGFEPADTRCRGDWSGALQQALAPLQIPWRDDGPGFVYLGVPPDPA